MEISRQDHRQAPRVPIKGVLALYENDQSMDRYQVVNLSRSGTLLASGQRYPVGTAMDLFIVTPELDVIEVYGEVVRYDSPRESIGVKFNLFGPGAELALEDLMNQMS